MYVIKRVFSSAAPVRNGKPLPWPPRLPPLMRAAGRNPSSVYIGGTGLPGEPGMV